MTSAEKRLLVLLGKALVQSRQQASKGLAFLWAEVLEAAGNELELIAQFRFQQAAPFRREANQKATAVRSVQFTADQSILLQARDEGADGVATDALHVAQLGRLHPFARTVDLSAVKIHEQPELGPRQTGMPEVPLRGLDQLTAGSHDLTKEHNARRVCLRADVPDKLEKALLPVAVESPMIVPLILFHIFFAF
jgi:hypothetical protein